ncbi:beta-glucosidase [Microbacterium halimionae]|uniref:Beta-glucosidase n=1 Tax=Microbacterium halimionae TaxID=1526413 RepID=A0A7W3JNU9_9MICO|nr:GH1 family beta-glucosidase [Microbacterium halimionae]MBA8816294.1 beta-glucosidase [Microbacterium halimionae]NII96497.1 beta-glucosidase [Microbacterium halimionae]
MTYPAPPTLPAGFRLGVATAAYQIEGATNADGRGSSIWDTFAQRPGVIKNGDTADIAIDHYHRLDEDLDHIAALGVSDYRFSLAWPRIVPGGLGERNSAGLAFYDRMVDGLLERGIRPVPTLYHWDLPQPLQDAGGWMSRETAYAFAEYADVAVTHLGDRVKDWSTMNEMSVHTLYGYALTDHAPALGLGLGALPAAHHLLLGHGLAVQVLRAGGAERVGVVNQHFPVEPASDAPSDIEAAMMFSALTNWTFSDPILRGEYPSEQIRAALPVSDVQLAEDLALISAPLDFYGVNYYEPTRIEAPKAGKDYNGILEVDIPEGLPFSPVSYGADDHTDFGWSIVPEALTAILLELHARYPSLPPVVITENGASFHDVVDADGAVHDARRIAFVNAHLIAVAAAVEAGVDVRGYYCWSAFDNFEWAAGYTERFGLVHVDYDTLVRTRKDSWFWYRDVVASLL